MYNYVYIKISGGFSKSHTPSPTLTPTPPNQGDHASGGNSSADELDLDVDLEGLNDLCCYICKTLNQGNGNKLMECHTCQNLYHQECHKPAISNQEADDPRLVWNCSSCSGPPVTKVSAHPSTKLTGSKVSCKTEYTTNEYQYKLSIKRMLNATILSLLFVAIKNTFEFTRPENE